MAMPPVTPSPAPIPRKVTIWLVVGWCLIAIKCTVTPYLMAHWRVPIDPGWVIVPTLIFALLISLLVVTRDWSTDDD